MEIRALTPAEQKYTYAQSMQLEGQTSNIGHLRGDFASSGYGFYTTWFDTRPQWKTDEFKKELDKVINSLREDKGLLHNRYDMSALSRKRICRKLLHRVRFSCGYGKTRLSVSVQSN